MKSMVIKAFIDTNILIDFLNQGREDHTTAVHILDLICKHKIEGLITTQSIIDAAFVCRRCEGYDEDVFRATILRLLGKINLGYLNYFHIKTALADNNKDLEDNAQIANAEDESCDVFLTHDKKLLSRPKRKYMQIMTPKEFLSRCLVND